MTFYEFMQTKTKQTDIIGFIAREMSMDTKLFPSLELKKSNVTEWQRRIMDRIKTGEVQDYIKDGFETAVSEFENELATIETHQYHANDILGFG